ncbi:hypothetical protein [Cupriavidus sp. EM10]|uniref:hypothetical protein n=1 Tax=Cupriavidus sp. EM10 TaxID=2839983 RepID=UPI001BFFFCFB|nr:hypothetical protein [Cupriavidus sp. EM10]QWE98280.1 hypothetical protein KLP38_30795 [Cupriavidus sp. EM10]
MQESPQAVVQDAAPLGFYRVGRLGLALGNHRRHGLAARRPGDAGGGEQAPVDGRPERAPGDAINRIEGAAQEGAVVGVGDVELLQRAGDGEQFGVGKGGGGAGHGRTIKRRRDGRLIVYPLLIRLAVSYTSTICHYPNNDKWMPTKAILHLP